MAKKTIKSNQNQDKPFDSYYSIIGKACGCSRKYAKQVLENNLGKYQDRDTDLVRRIRAKAKDILKAIEPNR